MKEYRVGEIKRIFNFKGGPTLRDKRTRSEGGFGHNSIAQQIIQYEEWGWHRVSQTLADTGWECDTEPDTHKLSHTDTEPWRRGWHWGWLTQADIEALRQTELQQLHWLRVTQAESRLTNTDTDSDTEWHWHCDTNTDPHTGATTKTQTQYYMLTWKDV